jgi:hypothetical protein
MVQRGYLTLNTPADFKSAQYYLPRVINIGASRPNARGSFL